MTLHELLSVLQFDSRRGERAETIAVGAQAEDFYSSTVSGVEFDSRKIKPNGVFVAIAGVSSHGASHIPSALAAGAIAVVTDQPFVETPKHPALYITVKDGVRSLHRLANHFYDYPSSKLLVAAATGTNGKTSSAYLLSHMLENVGIPCGSMTTVEHRFRDFRVAAENTTPDPVSVQSRMAEFQKMGARAIAMEASSHGLEQRRLDGLNISLALFTNLTQDHLDYHHTMESYFLAKQRLFTDLLWNSESPSRFAVVNTDDQWGRRLKVAQVAEVVTFGRARADVRFEVKKLSLRGSTILVNAPWARWEGEVPMLGTHNIYNIVGAATAVAAMGLPLEAVLNSMSTFTGVPGRLQTVANGNGLFVFVDYAHTPDALKNTLHTLCELRKSDNSNSRLYCVFGCGGDRDKSKRPLMAAAVEEYADRIILTSDNPRTEDASQILKDTAAGFRSMSDRGRITLEVNRQKAIELALAEARAGDIVLVAGKGHEDYQIIGTERVHFSDFEVVQNFFQMR